MRPITVVNCKTGSAPVKANVLIKPGSEGAQNTLHKSTMVSNWINQSEFRILMVDFTDLFRCNYSTVHYLYAFWVSEFRNHGIIK